MWLCPILKYLQIYSAALTEVQHLIMSGKKLIKVMEFFSYDSFLNDEEKIGDLKFCPVN